MKPKPPVRTTKDILRGGSTYRGTASLGAGYEGPKREKPKPKPSKRGQALVAVAVALALVTLAGSAWFARHAIEKGVASLDLGQARVTVSGNEYLSADEVREASGLPEKVSFFRVDLDKAKDRLLKNRRVLQARPSRRLNGEVRLDISERVPAALALYGRPVEVAADGTLLPPLVSGVTPDLPIVTGLHAPVKGKVQDDDWTRAVRWVRRLDDPALGLQGRVSEIDVSDEEMTSVVLAPHGARLLLPAEAREAEGLSGVRVVLADLASRGMEAATIDLRAHGEVVVTPVAGSADKDGKNKIKGNQKSPSTEAPTGAAVTQAAPRVTQDHEAQASGPERKRG